MSRCRSCGGLVRWALTERGERTLVDLPADPEGTIVLRERDGLPPLAIHGVPPETWPDEARYRSHWATCPDASEWRRRRMVKAR